MKEGDLRRVCLCGLCGKKIGHSAIPVFYRVRTQQYTINMQAVQSQQGLAMMLGGNGLLAMAMGQDNDIAEKTTDIELTVCSNCAANESLSIANILHAENRNK